MLDKILNQSDFKELLNEDLKHTLETSFNEAVELRANEIANNILKEKEDLLEQSFNEKVELRAAEIASESVEEQKIKLVEEFDAAKDELYETLLDKMDNFLQEQLDKFADAVANRLDESIASEKQKAILSIFDNLVETAGIDILKLQGCAVNETNNDYEELCEKYDRVVGELASSKIELEEYKFKVLIAEKTENMNLVEAEKFKKIASLVDRNSDYEKKLDALVESVKSKSKNNDEDDEDSKKEDDANNSKKEDKKVSESYLKYRY